MSQANNDAGNAVPVIELRNVSKTFGEVRSLSGVDFMVYPGEIVGLLGDNGAGKSTLVKTVMGFHRPNAGGDIFFKGKRIDDWSVARARGLGIETVYQERALCEKQPIWRNMFMGRELRTKWGLLDVERMRRVSPADERAHGIHLRRRSPGRCGDDHVRRREAGRRDHARALFRRRTRDPRRRHGPVARATKKTPAAASSDIRGGQGRESSFTTTSSHLSRRSTGAMRWTAASCCPASMARRDLHEELTRHGSTT